MFEDLRGPHRRRLRSRQQRSIAWAIAQGCTPPASTSPSLSERAHGLEAKRHDYVPAARDLRRFKRREIAQLFVN